MWDWKMTVLKDDELLKNSSEERILEGKTGWCNDILKILTYTGYLELQASCQSSAGQSTVEVPSSTLHNCGDTSPQVLYCNRTCTSRRYREG